MDNLWLIEIQVNAPIAQPEFSTLLAALRELYPASGISIMGVHVSYQGERAIIRYAQAVRRTHIDSCGVRDAEFKALTNAVVATCPSARGCVSVCALASTGATYKAEFYSIEEEG